MNREIVCPFKPFLVSTHLQHLFSSCENALAEFSFPKKGFQQSGWDISLISYSLSLTNNVHFDNLSSSSGEQLLNPKKS